MKIVIRIPLVLVALGLAGPGWIPSARRCKTDRNGGAQRSL